jgi:hypothetical protein
MKRRFILAAGVVAAATIGAVSLSSGQPSSPEDKALFAVMSGKKEVDSEGNKRAGDLDGRGGFTAIIDVDQDPDQFCYGITVKDIDAPVAAHIHIGRPNQAVAGNIVLPLQHPTSGDPGASSACVDIDSALAQAILKNPHKYYVNVHTAAFPDGAVRNQLFSRR